MKITKALRLHVFSNKSKGLKIPGSHSNKLVLLLVVLLVAGIGTKFIFFGHAASFGQYLRTNQALHANDTLVSPNGQYIAIMQPDGNFVVYNSAHQAIWQDASGYGTTPGQLIMQGDGNLVEYNSAGQAVWNSGTTGSTGSLLSMQDDGNLVIYNAQWQAVWSIYSGRLYPTVSLGTTLHTGQYLLQNEELTSSGGGYIAIMQPDGNFVVYNSAHQAIWQDASGYGTTPGKVLMQGDGNVVEYNSAGQAVWNSNTPGSTGNQLVMQPDGNLVIYNAQWQAVWSIETGRLYPTVSVGTTLGTNQYLVQNEELTSSSGGFKAILQPDGNFVVYNAANQPIWYDRGYGNTPGHVIMQPDGNLVHYNNANQPIWYNGALGRGSNNYLIMQPDGNLVEYTSAGQAVWSIQTGLITPPTVSLSAPASVVIGESPTLTITSANTRSCNINGVAVATSGSYAAPSINGTTTYTLTCAGVAGSASSSRTVAATPVDYGNLKDGAFDVTATIASTGPSKNKGYYYVSPSETSTAAASSVAASLYQANPKVQGLAAGSHSLGEVGIFNEQSNNFKTINGVEFGWIVGGKNTTSNKTRLFVYNVTDGYASAHGCYDGCGFVSTSSIKPGSVVANGRTAIYEISYDSKNQHWDLYYNDALFGYFPAARYQTYSGRSFTSGNYESAWGEVYNPGGQCIEMGNGTLGNKAGAASILDFIVNFSKGASATQLGNFVVSNPYDYQVGSKTAVSFYYGGPGGSGCT